MHTNKLKGISLVTIASLSALTGACLAESSPYKYATFVVEGLGNYTEIGLTVNNDGTVAGYSAPISTFDFHPFIDDGISAIDLGTFGGRDGQVNDLTNNGIAVGYAMDLDGYTRGFLWDAANGLQDIGSLGLFGSQANGINDSMQIVGATSVPDVSTYEAFIWEAGVMTSLGSLDNSKRSTAHAINSAGFIVGSSRDANLRRHPIMWTESEMIDLGSLGNGTNDGQALDINDLGQVVGSSNDDSEVNHAFIWEDGVMTALTGQQSFATAINSQSQVVGGLQLKGFVWTEQKGLHLFRDIASPYSGYEIMEGRDVSDSGYIVAIGESTRNQIFTTFLLVPVTPELSLSDPVPGVAGQTNTWTITNAPANSKVTLAYSFNGGGTVVPGCDRLDAVVQLRKPKVIKTVTADANGVAEFRINVPAIAANLGPVLVQAVSVNDCQESNLNVYDFE